MDASADLSNRVDRLEVGFEVRMDRLETRMGVLETRMGGLETRMDRLETRMDGLDGRLRALEVKVGEMSGKLDILTGQIIGKLPSWWQMPAVMGGMIALFGAMYAIAKRMGLG